MCRVIGERASRVGTPVRDFADRHPALAGLILFGLLAAASRPASFRTPLERDTGQYLYIGGVILDGGTPYVDAANNKGPFTFLLFAVVKLGAGTSAVAVRLALLAFTAAAALAIAAYLTHLAGRSAGVLGGAIFAVLSSTMALQGEDPNTEQFGVAFMVGAWWLAARGRRTSAAATGALTVLAVMMNAGFVAIAPIVLFELWRANAREQRLGAIAAAAAGGMAAALPPLLWLTLAGALDDMRQQVFAQAADAVTGNVPAHLGPARVTDYLSPRSLLDVPAGALWVGGLAGCAAAMSDRRLRIAAVGAAAWIVVMWVRVKLSHYSFVHHYYLAMPGIAAGLALGVVSLWGSSRGQRVAITALVLTVPVWSYVVGPQWRALGITASERWGPNSSFSLAYPVADFIRSHTASDERILVSGSEPEVYWLADRRASTRFFDLYAVSWRPQYASERRRALSSHPPAAVGALPGGDPDPDLQLILKRFSYRLAFERNGARVWLPPR